MEKYNVLDDSVIYAKHLNLIEEEDM